jgi:competence protein ComFC
MLQKFKNEILDTLFPKTCAHCEAEGAWLCSKCLAEIKLLPVQVCPKCEKFITEKGILCHNCKKDFASLDSLIVAAKYGDAGISKLVHLFKYNFVEEIACILADFQTKALLKNNARLPNLIVPIPLHSRRLRWRGFNQSELLADHISKNLAPGFAIPVASDLIIRKKYTPPQMQIKKFAERRKNIQDAFEINSASLSKYPNTKNILLVDDIATTGATLFECAKVLKQNGVKKVFAVVVARQEFEK